MAHLEPGNADVDRRHDRREVDAGELRRLLAAARDSDRPFRGLTGADRFHLYAAACGTGFRASALASLTPESFDLAGEPPTVTLAARNNKSRKGKVQPLPPDVADLLRGYLDGRPAGQSVWGGTWASDRVGAEMLRFDLAAAGIPYTLEGPDGPLFADFHALRHSYLTLGGRAGIDLRTLQELAGHSTPVLTARYSHRRLHDLAGAVEKLPRLLPDDTPAAEVAAFRATGTDGAAAGAYRLLASAAGKGGETMTMIDNGGRKEGQNTIGRNRLTLKEGAADRESMRAPDVARHDSQGRAADFHSFRYTFCRLMGQKLPIQKVKTLMGHSTIKLTADLYGELGMEDVAEDVWTLPALAPKIVPTAGPTAVEKSA